MQPQSAFYCDACKCGLKDSQAWFDHINGKKHNRVKGMSMVVEQVDVQRVREKLQSLKKGVLGKRLHQETHSPQTVDEPQHFQKVETPAEEPEPEEKVSEHKSEAPSEHKSVESESSEEEDEDAALLAYMGLPSSFK